MGTYGYVGEATNARWKDQETERKHSRWYLNNPSKTFGLFFNCFRFLLCINVFFEFFVLYKAAFDENNQICMNMHIQYSFLV